MSNMSYCRFRNTLSALRDCVEAVEEILQHGADGPDPEVEYDGLSGEELTAAGDMAVQCMAFLRLYAETADLTFEQVEEQDDMDTLAEGVCAVLSDQFNATPVSPCSNPVMHARFDERGVDCPHCPIAPGSLD